MRLSEAIRLGATLSPQGFGGGEGGPAARCALAAARDATGVADLYSLHREVLSLGPHRCLDCGAQRTSTWNMVIHLNDRHRWTRERIADWVATQELKQLPSPCFRGTRDNQRPPEECVGPVTLLDKVEVHGFSADGQPGIWPREVWACEAHAFLYDAQLRALTHAGAAVAHR